MPRARKSHACSFCGEIFNLESTLKIHQMEHDIRTEQEDNDPLLSAKEKKISATKNSCDIGRSDGLIKSSLSEICETNDNVSFKITDVCRNESSTIDAVLTTSHSNINASDSSSKAMPILSNENRKKFNCNECGKQFFMKRNLDSHLLDHKSSQKTSKDNDSGKRPTRIIPKSDVSKSVSYKRIFESCSNEAKELICGPCGKSFTLRHSLMHHLRVHKMKENHWCDKCDTGFRSQKSLDDHNKLKHIKIDFVCKICKKTFSKRPYLKAHMSVHKNREIFKCSECDKAFSTQKSLDKHFVKEHLSPESSTNKDDERSPRHKKYECFLCTEVFPKRTLLWEHRRQVHEKELSCLKCNLTFKDVKGLHHHIARKHWAKLGNPVQCEYCSKTFVNRKGYKIHELIHKGEKPFKCEECGVCFTQKHHLKRHTIKHMDKESMEKNGNDEFCLCELCGKSFKRREYLKFHMKSHLQDKKRIAGRKGKGPTMKGQKCDECSEEFSSVAALNNHNAFHHPNMMPSCQICSQTFTYSYLLKQHYIKHSIEELETLDEKLKKDILEIKYKNEKIHKCLYCDKLFRAKYTLDKHIRTHTGERPYKCSECDKSFVQNTHMKMHLAVVHSKIKPYVCNVCGKSFALQNYLYNHKKIHNEKVLLPSKEKTMYRNCCLQCGKKFVSKRGLTCHQMSCVRSMEVKNIYIDGSSNDFEDLHSSQPTLVELTVIDRTESTVPVTIYNS